MSSGHREFHVRFRPHNVRYYPDNGHSSQHHRCPLLANNSRSAKANIALALSPLRAQIDKLRCRWRGPSTASSLKIGTARFGCSIDQTFRRNCNRPCTPLISLNDPAVTNSHDQVEQNTSNNRILGILASNSPEFSGKK